MKFTKMQGAGNDYVYVNCFEEKIEEGDRPELSRRLSDRNFGVGGDGLIFICPSDKADFRMDMYNADGSPSGMCGNGIRCVSKYVYDRCLTDREVITIETGSGIKTLNLRVEDGAVKAVRVDMGTPILRPRDIPVNADSEDFICQPVEVGGRIYEVTAVSVGNPHAVVFVDDADSFDVTGIGPKFENHPLFPERVNAEFVQVIDRQTLKMRVWERGSGETLACGTGATASMYAAKVSGFVGDRARLILRGGELDIEWSEAENTLYMTGPAEFVFDGELMI